MIQKPMELQEEIDKPKIIVGDSDTMSWVEMEEHGEPMISSNEIRVSEANEGAENQWETSGPRGGHGSG